MSDSGFVFSKNQGGIIVAPVIYIQPVEGWGYFVREKTRLSNELVEIASNESTNTSVYMTEEDGRPYLYVYRDDKKIFQSACATIYETERNLRVVYAQYLEHNDSGAKDQEDEDENIPMPDDDGNTPPLSDLDAMSEKEFHDYVDEREGVISAAVSAMIEVLTEDDASELELDPTDEACLDNIVDHIVEYLAIDCGLRIRRPMTVVDDDSGFDVRTEYPYEDFDFRDDELHK